MLKLRNLWKSLALFAALVCFATASYGQGSVFQNQVFGPTGAPKGGATITVCNNAGTTLANCPGPNNANLAQIFSDQALTLPLANPLTADGLGNFQFFAASGIYYYTVTGAGTTSPGPYIAILYCIPNGSCGLGSQFPWTNLAFSSTPVITVGNGNVNYFMGMTGPVTSVTFTGTPHNGDYLGIYFFNNNGSAISTGVFPANVQFPGTFSFNIAPNTGYLMAWTYASISSAWIPTAVWSNGGGGGSSFYQFVQQAGTQKTQRQNLNFLAPITATDNPGNTSTDISIPLNYQTILNNAVSLPVEPKVNLVPPLTAVDNPANTRTDINCPSYVGVGGSHSAGCMIDPGASGAATDYPGRDAQWHTSVSAATIKPDISAGIQYVASLCNGGGACSDANDGLSWGTAKLTPYAALLALPGGSVSPPQAGHGIVYVSSDPINGIAFGGPVGGGLGGWWMFGPTDPGYAGGVTGWMRAPANNLGVTMECASPNTGTIHNFSLSCLEFWGGHADNTHPAVWFSGFSGQAVLKGFHFNYEAVGIKLGIDSTNNRSATSGVSSVWLDKDAVNLGSCYSNIGAGPAVDIGGASFWIRINDGSYSGCTTQDYTISSISRSSNVVTVTVGSTITNDLVSGGNSYVIIRNVADPTFNGAYLIASTPSSTSFTYAQNGPNASSSGGQAFPYGAAAIGINSGTGPGAGFVYADDVTVNGGGMWAQGGFNGVGLSAYKTLYEGSGTPDMSIIEVLPTAVPGADGQVYVSDVQLADNTVPICGVESFATSAIDVSVSNSSVCGPMTNLGGSVVGSVSPLRQGMSGFYNGRGIAASIDASRRVFPPSVARFVNGVSTNNSGWTTTGLTVTSGQLAPDGTSQAYLLANPTGGTILMNFGGQFSATPQLGSYYIFGVWLRSATAGVVAPGLFFNLNSGGVGVGNYCQGGTTSVGANIQSARITGDGEWEWFSGICKIITNPSNGNQRFDMNIPANTSVVAYAPVFGIIAAGSISDNEAWELANNLHTYAASSAVGDVATLPGQHLRTDDVALNAITAPTGAAGSTHLYMDSTANWPSFKPNGNTAYIAPGFTGTWTAGQCATATATVNVFNLGTCGSGSGTITPSQQFNLTYYSGAGSSSTINGATAPTTFAEPYYWVTIPSGGVATAPQAALPGVPGRTTAAASDTILFSDRANRVEYTDGAAVTVTLPAAGSAGFSNNMVFQAKSRGNNSVVTFNQGAGNCNGGGAGTCVLKQGQVGTFKTIDNTNWFMDAHEPPITCGTNLVCTRSDYGLTLSSTAGGGTLTATGLSLPNGQLIVGNVYPDTKPADLSGDCSTSGSTVTTCTRLNGGAFSGANGDLVSFGAANIPADSGVVAANAVTAGSNFTTGDLVQAAGNNKTTSDSGVIAANVVTNSTGNAAAAQQIIVSGGANKTVKAIDFPDVHVIPSANCNNTSAGAGWSIGSGGAVLCRAGTNNKGGYIQITDTAATFATFQIHIPKDWDTGSNPFISFDISSTDATSGHTIIPSIQVACYKGDGSTTDDIAPQAAHSLSTVTLNTTTNQFWSTSNVQLSNTDMTGCSGGSLMQITVGRATDTATNAQFYSATMTFPRLLVVQAN